MVQSNWQKQDIESSVFMRVGRQTGTRRNLNMSTNSERFLARVCSLGTNPYYEKWRIDKGLLLSSRPLHLIVFPEPLPHDFLSTLSELSTFRYRRAREEFLFNRRAHFANSGGGEVDKGEDEIETGRRREKTSSRVLGESGDGHMGVAGLFQWQRHLRLYSLPLDVFPPLLSSVIVSLLSSPSPLF